MHDPHGLYELRWRCGFVNIAFRAGGKRFQNRFIVSAAAGNNDAQIRTSGLEAGHHVKKVLSGPCSQQNKVDIFAWAQFSQTA